MIDKTTQQLFGEFPRDVGNPKRRMVYNLLQLEYFITQNDGVSDCFVSVYPSSLRTTEIFFDLDGKDSLGDAKKLYSAFREKGYPVVPVASGKKGYHLHLIVKENGCTKEQLIDATYSVLAPVFETTSTIDTHSVGDLRRLCRIPNTLRPPENLNYCTYLPPDFPRMSEKEVAEHIKSPHNYEYDLRNPPVISELCKGVKTHLSGFDQKSRPQGERIDWIIERYVPKVIEGHNYWLGRCPFHDDEHPSFCVYPDRFICFGCGIKGDLIAFIERMKKLRGIKNESMRMRLR